MDGPEVTIHGNAGWALAENLMSGRVHLTRDAGASVAASMRGGRVFVGGDAGARAGISMKGGDLVIAGSAGFLAGFMMQKGRMIICGDVGEGVGDSMYEGAIYVGERSAPWATTPRWTKSARRNSSASGKSWKATASRQGPGSARWCRRRSSITSTSWSG